MNDDYTQSGCIGNYLTTGYTNDGWKISIAVNILPGDAPGDAMKRLQSEVHASGLQLNPAGIDDGQIVETIQYVCKREKTNQDGTSTPVIAMYVGELEYKWKHVYLNTPEQCAEFEAAAHVSLKALPPWPADSFPQRNTGNKQADAHVVKVTPFKCVMEAYGEGTIATTGATYTKYKLVRFEALTANGSTPVSKPTPSGGSVAAQPYDYQVVMASRQLADINSTKRANILNKHAAEFDGMTNQQVVAWVIGHIGNAVQTDANADAIVRGNEIPF